MTTTDIINNYVKMLSAFKRHDVNTLATFFKDSKIYDSMDCMWEKIINAPVVQDRFGYLFAQKALKHNKEAYREEMLRVVMDFYNSDLCYQAVRYYAQIYYDNIKPNDGREEAIFERFTSEILTHSFDIKLMDIKAVVGYALSLGLEQSARHVKIHYLDDAEFKKIHPDNHDIAYFDGENIVFNEEKFTVDIANNNIEQRDQKTQVFGAVLTAYHELAHAKLKFSEQNIEFDYLNYLANMETIAQSFTKTPKIINYNESFNERYCNQEALRASEKFFTQYGNHILTANEESILSFIDDFINKKAFGYHCYNQGELVYSSPYVSVVQNEQGPSFIGESQFLTNEMVRGAVAHNKELVKDNECLQVLYHENGRMKTVDELLKDYLQALDRHPTSQKQVTDFYSNIILDAVDYIDNDEINNVFADQSLTYRADALAYMLTKAKTVLKGKITYVESEKDLANFERGREEKLNKLYDKTIESAREFNHSSIHSEETKKY